MRCVFLRLSGLVNPAEVGVLWQIILPLSASVGTLPSLLPLVWEDHHILHLVLVSLLMVQGSECEGQTLKLRLVVVDSWVSQETSFVSALAGLARPMLGFEGSYSRLG